MRTFNVLLRASFLVGVVLAFLFSPSVGAQQLDWPVYRADALEYAGSGLPSPMVIYVYTADAKLIGIINAHGHSDKQALGKIGNMIGSQNFAKQPAKHLAAVAKSLNYFLLDQGHDIGKMVDSKSKYTLLLTGWTVKKDDCPFYTEIQDRYIKLLQKSIPKQGEGSPIYSVARLQIGSPKQALKCSK